MPSQPAAGAGAGAGAGTGASRNQWDYALVFKPKAKDLKVNVERARAALTKQGFRVEVEPPHILQLAATDAMVRFEVQRSELELPSPDAVLTPNQRLDMVHSALEHVSMADEADKPNERPAIGTETDVGELDGAAGFVHRWAADGLCEVVPLHDKATCTALYKATLWSLSPPVQELRDYYGEHVTLYFLWMQFFTRWLWAPGLAGAALYLLRPEGKTVDESPWVPFFSLFMVVWGVLFLRYWQRENASWAHRWGCLEFEKRERLLPDHRGVVRVSPVTGKLEVHFSLLRRVGPYIVSVCVTGAMLALAFLVMLCSLNLQGYIKRDTSAFHIEFFADYAEPGALFDPNGHFAVALIPVVGHSMIILVLNYFYSSIAVYLTDKENHRTEAEYENALILKRFLFEAFDAYIPLFYLAFYEQDVMLLRTELVSLYTTDAVRRVITESLLPWTLQWLGSVFNRKWEGRVKQWTVQEQAHRGDYEQFDDYLEMVVEFGYITLFASAFPLAAALSIACNFIEVRSDMFKLAYVCRRPAATRASTIGTWQTVLTAQVWLSVTTNCLIFAFASDQMSEWFPWLFKVTAEGDVMKLGAGRQVVGTAWLIEHVIFIFALAIWAFIPQWPEHVRVAVERERYEEHEARRALLGAKESTTQVNKTEVSSPSKQYNLRRRKKGE